MKLGARPDAEKRRRSRRITALTTRLIRVLRPCEIFGLYTVRERIGEGSTCSVFAAEHPGLRGPLAIKVLHRKLLGDPTVAQRMLDEARTISMLDHRGIVDVFDIGYSTEGRPYVVLERLVGEPLSERLRRGRLPEDHILTFTGQLASALEVAHRDGIIHRDLKPANLYIVADPASPCGERIKVLDFGIAKSRASTCHTGTGIVLGTPAYMAPEQARGVRHLDGRADIYALGVVMYVMATGALPFTGADTEELLAEHAYCEPVPVAELADVTPELAAIIQRCLAKRREQRYPGMGELAAALADLEARRGGPAVTPAPPPAPPSRWPWRRVLALAMAAVTAIVIATAIGMAPTAADLDPALHPVPTPPLPAASECARLRPRKPAPPPSAAKRVVPAKPDAPAKPVKPARAQDHGEPDAPGFPQHEPPFPRWR